MCKVHPKSLIKILFDQKTAQLASKGDLRQNFMERVGWILIITTIQMKITFN